MKKLLFLIIPLIVFGFLFSEKADAATCQSHNVSGWAWSNMDDPITPADERSIGWISFSCENPEAPAPYDFGVDIDPVAGNFSGHAWSENIGWVSFNRSEAWPPPSPLPPCESVFGGYGDVDDDKYVSSNDSSLIRSGGLSNEQQKRGDVTGDGNTSVVDALFIDQYITGQVTTFTPCGTATAPLAKLDLDDNKIYGWARALSYGGGWDGWIKLRGTAQDSSPYGVSVSGSTGDFSGWAWSDMVIGWINFSGVNYKVETALFSNQPPDKPNKVGDGESFNSCAWGSVPLVAAGTAVTFRWDYYDRDGDRQEAYEIEVSDDSGFASGKQKFNNLVDLAATSYILDLSEDETPSDWLSELVWGAVYHWRVRVKDNRDSWSTWSSSDSFQMPSKAYPNPQFSWLPSEPTQGEIIIFTPEATGFSYFWEIPQGEGVFDEEAGPSNEKPYIKFSTPANKVRLTITDSSSPSPARSCSKEEDVEVQLPLPEYKEIPPVTWFKKMFAGLLAFLDGF